MVRSERVFKEDKAHPVYEEDDVLDRNKPADALAFS